MSGVLLVLLTASLIILLAKLFWRRPGWGLPALFASLPFERIPSYELSLMGNALTIRPSQLIGAALIAATIPKLREVRLERFEWFPLVYLAAGGVSLWGAPSLSRGLLVIAFTLFAWLLYVAVRYLAAQVDLRQLEVVLWWAVVITVAFGLYQYTGDRLGLSIDLTGLKDAYTKHVFGFPRIQSFALEPLYLANFLLLPLGIFAALLIREPTPRRYTAVFLLLLALTLTVSRGGYAGAVIALITTATLLRSGAGAIRLAVTGGLGVVVGVVLISGITLWKPKAVQQVTTLTQHATDIEVNQPTGSEDPLSERGIGRKTALEAFRSRPLFGIGIGNYGHWMHDRHPEIPDSVIVNNEPLELLAETGMVGAGAMALFVLGILRRSWQLFRAKLKPGPEYLWLVGLTAVVLAWVVQYLSFSTLYITYIWAALGLLVSIQGRIVTMPKRRIRKAAAS